MQEVNCHLRETPESGPSAQNSTPENYRLTDVRDRLCALLGKPRYTVSGTKVAATKLG